ncbi:MAG: DMT family transporter [Vicinamibacteria bacterium]
MLTRYVVTLLMVVAGAGIAFQATINARLRESVMPATLAALISFLVGSLALTLITASGVAGRAQLQGIGRAPWWIWTGGLLGALYVTAAVVAVPRVGAGVVMGAGILGQLVAALVIDSQGWLGVSRVPLSLGRAFGALLLMGGAWLIQRG